MKFQVYNLWKDNLIKQFILISIDGVFGLPGDGGFISICVINLTFELSWKGDGHDVFAC